MPAITSSYLKKFVDEINFFEDRSWKVKNRFYNFILANDPKAFASYSITPLGRAVELSALELDIKASTYGLYFETEAIYGDDKAYMVIPYEYLDDAPAWEEKVLAELAFDKALATNAVVAVFGESKDMAYTVTRNSYNAVGEYLDIQIDSASMTDERWGLFRKLVPLNGATITVSRRTGKVYEGRGPFGVQRAGESKDDLDTMAEAELPATEK